jgi:hypothetical protein
VEVYLQPQHVFKPRYLTKPRVDFTLTESGICHVFSVANAVMTPMELTSGCVQKPYSQCSYCTDRPTDECCTVDGRVKPSRDTVWQKGPQVLGSRLESFGFESYACQYILFKIIRNYIIIIIIIIIVILLGAPMLPTWRWVKISTYLHLEPCLLITYVLLVLDRKC